MDSHNHDNQNNHENHDEHEHDHHDHHAMMVKDFRRRFFVSLVLMVPILILSPMIQEFMGVDFRFSGDSYILFGLSTILFFYGGKPFLTGVLDELKDKTPAMMMLITLAITVAYVYSSLTVFFLPGGEFFWELATLIVVMLLGHWIEMKSVMGASNALNELVKLMPEEAHQINENGDTEDVMVKELKEGDAFLVKPGEKVPIDGQIYEGNSAIDESMVTGESVPVEKGKGDEVVGGSINREGVLKCKVSHIGDETFLSQVIISCPHALGLAMPLVTAVSTGIGAKNGLLVRNRAAFEGARNINAIIFDKTGTLTKGEFGVTDLAGKTISDKELLSIAYSVELNSEHPIAKGITNEGEAQEVEKLDVENYQNLPGKGLEARVDGKNIKVVSPGYMRDEGVSFDEEAYEKLAQEGKTVSTYRKMVQNLAWATGYNLLAIPLAAGVLYNQGILISPAVGAVLMSLSTVIVAANARLLKLE